MESNPSVARLHYFDGLRAVACLLILFHHMVTANIVQVLTAHHMKGLADIIFNFTQSGVELFFVLSGIVLLRPYFTGVKTFHVIKYANRRFWRIYVPFFFAVCFAGFVIFINTFYPTWYSEILIDFTPEGFARQFLLFNWKGDYYNLAWWSLQIEIVFYLFIPLIVYVGKSWKLIPATVITCILSLLLQKLALIYFPDQYSIDHIVLGPVRIVDYLLCFLFGILLAKEEFKLSVARIFIAMALILWISASWYVPFYHMSLAFLYFGVLIIVIQSPALQLLLSSNIMVWIGERSYSLFLTHFSVLYLTNYIFSYVFMERSFLYGVCSRVLGILLSFLTAMILFHFVERKQAHGLQTAHQFWPSLKG